MKFDVVLTNPPFQNRETRGRTPHKLWIEFTKIAFQRLLKPDGLLYQVSPSSFQSPSNKVLPLMQQYTTVSINFDAAQFFPHVGSTFAYYTIRNTPNLTGQATVIVRNGRQFTFLLDHTVRWLPVDLNEEALNIHRKVMFLPGEKLPVEHDYVTCHNSRVKPEKGGTLSKTRTEQHVYPVFHTNPQTWYSTIQQPWALEPKILWTQSGYTKPFYDDGVLGGTDLVYRIIVENEEEGEALLHNLNSKLIRYIFATARWSGFGNENVFNTLPALPKDKFLTDEEMFDVFQLTRKERDYVDQYLT